jgi:carboxymethylenebutenolidase
MAMGARVSLISEADGFALDAYHVAAQEARRGGLVILHAVWGVTPHIRALADQFADEGYEVLCPSLLGRFEAGFADLGLDPARLDQRSSYAAATGWGGECAADIQAAIDALDGPVFVLGFCFGGTAAWIAACQCTGIAAVSSFYGGQIVDYRDQTPQCPIILHLGRHDGLIPQSDRDAITAVHPDLPIWLYDAGHAFVAPNGYHADSANLALLRTRQLFQRQGRKGEM